MSWNGPIPRWSPEQEAEFQREHADEIAKQREQAQNIQESREFAAFASGRAEQARKAGNAQRAADWQAAEAAIEGGQWPVGRTIASDPGITRFQALRTRCLYLGATKRIDPFDP